MKKVWIYLVIAVIFLHGSLLSFVVNIPFWKGLIIAGYSAIMASLLIMLIDYAVNGKK